MAWASDKKDAKPEKDEPEKILVDEKNFDQYMSPARQASMKNTQFAILKMIHQSMDEMITEGKDELSKLGIEEHDAIYAGIAYGFYELYNTVSKDLDGERELIVKVLSKTVRKLMESKEVAQYIKELKDGKA